MGNSKINFTFSWLKISFSVLPTTTWPLCFGPPMNRNHFPWKSLYPILQNCLTLSEYRIAEEFSFDKNVHTSMKRRKAILFNGNSLLANIWLKDIQFSSSPIFLISSITGGIQSIQVCLSFFCLLFSLVDGTECDAVFDFFAYGLS